MATCRSCVKCLKRTCEIVSYCVCWLKFSNFSTKKGLYKRDFLKNFSKFSDKHKQQSSGCVQSKDILKNFVKFTDKTPLLESPFKQSCRLETLNRQKQPLLIVCKTSCCKKCCKFLWKKSMLESIYNKVGVLRACNFIKEDFFLWIYKLFKNIIVKNIFECLLLNII